MVIGEVLIPLLLREARTANRSDPPRLSPAETAHSSFLCGQKLLTFSQEPGSC